MVVGKLKCWQVVKLDQQEDLIFFKKNFHKQKNSLHLQPQRDGIIAQLVEQRTENPCVAGSIPADTTSQKSLFSIENGLFLCFLGVFLHYFSMSA